MNASSSRHNCLRNFSVIMLVLLIYLMPARVIAEAPISMRGMFDNLSGLSLSANKIKYENSENNGGKAFNGQVVFILPSFAFEHVSSKFNSDNIFVGIGFANLIQIQTGSGDQGGLWRVRSDLFLPYYFKEGWSDPFFPTYVDNWWEKLCLSLNYTEYHDAKIGRQYQIGIGFGF